MIPERTDDLRQDFSLDVISTSKTYHISKNRIFGFVDGREAMEQAVYKILSTERYNYIIYSWNYGVELTELIGKPMVYIAPELEQRITEALTQDQRILSVDAFSFETKRSSMLVSFTVHTIFGDVKAEKEVSY
ncbi:DUF2634 domain-containing protein [Sinanaerobacter sp. ZZT-01]|uniref:DUF2634 domain-containing protein n=1 Tax=Sinanaerobacter sp. ZZT-01 TaxID=3111540 RepID=UPI002D7A1E95|nr:DUF2634 domain-containing protein [Sinanaerobacter sp. ZZT-01]WRR94085.1 DUF2634 domain-containing protein [Sinanaerobacter sp. ZZT-01]